MTLVSALVVYFITWWVVLFAILPIGVTSHEEAGEKIEPGTVSSAPFKPRLARKFALTTGIATIIWAAVYVVLTFNLVGLDDIPFLSQFG